MAQHKKNVNTLNKDICRALTFYPVAGIVAPMTVRATKHNGYLCVQCERPAETDLVRGVWPMRFSKKWNCYVMGWGPVGMQNLYDELLENPEISFAFSEECKAMLRAFKGTLSARDMVVADDVMLPGIKTKPWAHQYRAVQMAKGLDGFQLQMDMGTGKTLVALALLAHWSAGCTAKRIMIVCPKSVVDVWPAEFDKHMTTAERSRYLVTPLNQRTVAAKVVAADRAEELAFQKGMLAVHVINYDAIWRPEMAQWLKSKEVLVSVMDESHRIKSHNGRAARFMGDMLGRTSRRLGLTGTPMPHSPLDIFAQYRAFSQDVFGTIYGDFKVRYAVMGGFEMKQVIGFKNERDMNQRVESISYRVKKGDVLTLPPVMHEIRHVELCASAKAIYKTMKRDLYAMVGDGEVTAANALVKVLRLLQITSGVVELDDGTKEVIDDSKIKGFSDLVLDLPPAEPLVVFSRFTRDIDMIRVALAEQGRTCAVLDGRMNQLREWQAGEFNDIAVQIRAGGAGVDLTRSCYGAYYTQTHSLGDYDQSLARLDRPGQTRPVTYYHLVSKGTIDEQIYAALQQKRDVVEFILEGIKKVQTIQRGNDNAALQSMAINDALKIFMA